jgi:hypothetical protein
MSLMLHAAPKRSPTTSSALLRRRHRRQRTSPSHFRVVDLIAHSLAYFGHQVTEQHFGVTPDGMRFFGVLCLKSEYTGYTDIVGLRNSHDRKFPVGVSFGSRVFVCDNLAFSGDHVVKRKHTLGLKRDLPGLIGEIIEPLAQQREAQKVQYDLLTKLSSASRPFHFPKFSMKLETCKAEVGITYPGIGKPFVCRSLPHKVSL